MTDDTTRAASPAPAGLDDPPVDRVFGYTFDQIKRALDIAAYHDPGWAASPDSERPNHKPVWDDDVPTGWCSCGEPWPHQEAKKETPDGTTD